MTQRTTRPQRALVDASGADRVAAAAVAISCNLVCAWLLFRVPAPEPDLAGSAALQVVWVRPAAPLAPQAPLADIPAERPAAVLPRPRQPDVSQQATAPAPRELAHLENVGPEPSTAVDEAESPRSLEPAPVARGVPPAGQQPGQLFAPNPFGPRMAPAGVARDRMQLRMSDRSLGGRWKDLSRAVICGELRQGLHGSPESVLSIEASMRRHGCGSY